MVLDWLELKDWFWMGIGLVIKGTYNCKDALDSLYASRFIPLKNGALLGLFPDSCELFW